MANAVKLDMSKENPLNDEMKFVYDDDGRIAQCYYNLCEYEICISCIY